MSNGWKMNRCEASRGEEYISVQDGNLVVEGVDTPAVRIPLTVLRQLVIDYYIQEALYWEEPK